VLLLFFFVPWSAINPGGLLPGQAGKLRCAVVLHPDGIYGRIQWWAGICHVITLAVQVPFLDQLFYAGPLVKPPGGADISWIAGFGVASLLYSAGAKRFVSVRPGLAAASTVGHGFVVSDAAEG
jgi:NCS1 family nucleobase:cation symporter-1